MDENYYRVDFSPPAINNEEPIKHKIVLGKTYFFMWIVKLLLQ